MIRLVLGFVAVAAVTSGAVAQPAVERGSYLVNTIMTCANCHSPKGPPPAVAGKDFSGGLRFNEPPFDVTAPNNTEVLYRELFTRLLDLQLVKKNDLVILTKGELSGVQGGTNAMLILKVALES